MRERDNTAKDATIKGIEAEQECGEVKTALEIFRYSVHMAAERPELFWKTQRATIVSKLTEPWLPAWVRPCFALVPAAIAVLVCLFFLGESGKTPAPDIAAGADQELLIDIERTLSREYPEAFLPLSIP